MQQLSIVPPTVDVPPADDLDTLRQALDLPPGTHFVADEDGIVAIQVQHQHSDNRRMLGVAEVRLGQHLTADQLITALVQMKILPHTPADMLVMYERLGLQTPASLHRLTVESLPGAQTEASHAGSFRDNSLVAPGGDARPVREKANRIADHRFNAHGVPTAARSTSHPVDEATLVPCGYGDCTVRKPAGRPIKMHRIRGHGLIHGELPTDDAHTASSEAPNVLFEQVDGRADTAPTPNEPEVMLREATVMANLERTPAVTNDVVDQEEPPPNF